MDALLELSDVDGAAGGKAQGLARLTALGLPVPPALVLSPDVYARWRAGGRLDEHDVAALTAAFDRLGPPIAVRSSALDEDTQGRSAAGQYESVMGVRSRADLVAAVEGCFHAARSERAVAYRGSDETSLALLLQREIPAGRAGVAFSVDPMTGDARHVLLEVVYGHGERLVGGLTDPDRFWVPRGDGPVRARIAPKAEEPPARRFARTLRDDEARGLARLVLRAEDGFGRPVDVEFCFDRARAWLLQCRPVTTLDGGD
jgi:phosphoenolpyruvate synthase/pyruvate phosphate dikinase